MYLVPLWALFSWVRRRMEWAPLSSKVSPSGLFRALLSWSGSFWRCQVTRICTPPFGPRSWRRYWIVPSHQMQSPVWALWKGCWTSCLFGTLGTLRAGAVLVAGGSTMTMPGPGGEGRPVGRTPGWSGGLGGCGGFGGCCLAVFSGLLGG